MAVQPSDKQQLSLGTLLYRILILLYLIIIDFFHDYLDPTSEAGFIKYFDSLPEVSNVFVVVVVFVDHFKEKIVLFRSFLRNHPQQ